MPDALLRRVRAEAQPKPHTDTISAVIAPREKFAACAISICPDSETLTIMNTSIHPVREYTAPTELRRLSVLDRLALHGGLALLRWAHRGQSAAEPTDSRLARHPRRPLDGPAERRELVAAHRRLRAVG